MIILDYKLDSEELKKLKNLDLSQITSTDLDYYLFRGDIFFRTDSENLDAPWGWVSIIDFSTHLYLISCEIKDNEQRVFDFNESEATIKFQRIGEYIYVKPSYVPRKAKTTVFELKQASMNFFKRVLSEISNEYPQLLKNQFFIERVSLLDNPLESDFQKSISYK